MTESQLNDLRDKQITITEEKKSDEETSSAGDVKEEPFRQASHYYNRRGDNEL
jgi:hypothetical protein